MKSALIAAWLATALIGCGAAAVPADDTVPVSPGSASDACHDWVHDATGGVEWQPNDETDGITTLTGKVPGSDFVAFRGAGVIDAPIAKVAGVLIDTSRYGEWVSHFGGVRIVRSISDTEKVIYRHVTTPVIDDRDFVLDVRTYKDDDTGHLLFDLASIEDPDAPVDPDKVRGHISPPSGYRLWAIDGGKRTMLIFTIHVDPRGSVPAWIVNLFQDGYPLDTLRSIRAQAAKPDVEPDPRVAKAFRDYIPPCTGR